MLRRVSDGLRQSAARYHELFEQSPIGIGEEDVSAARAKIEGWRGDGVRDFRMFFGDHPEVLREAVAAIRLIDLNQTAVEIYGLADRVPAGGRPCRAGRPRATLAAARGAGIAIGPVLRSGDTAHG